MQYLSAGEWLKQQFGEKVYRLSLSSGCTCPNRDGTIGFGCCTFCSEGGSGEFEAPFLPVEEQIRIAKQRVAKKLRDPEKPHKYIAYFQSFTNTYGDPERLRDIFFQAARQPEIAAVSIATRPDCISIRMLEVLTELNGVLPVMVELGLQTIHEETAVRIRRGYGLPVFTESFRKLKERGLMVIVHMILGLPGETEEDMLESVRFLAGLRPLPDGVKLQMLNILRGSAMEQEYRTAPFPMMDLETYADLIVRCLRVLPEEVVIHRLTGDGPKRLLVAPLWCADKKRVLNTILRKIREAEPRGKQDNAEGR